MQLLEKLLRGQALLDLVLNLHVLFHFLLDNQLVQSFLLDVTFYCKFDFIRSRDLSLMRDPSVLRWMLSLPIHPLKLWRG